MSQFAPTPQPCNHPYYSNREVASELLHLALLCFDEIPMLRSILQIHALDFINHSFQPNHYISDNITKVEFWRHCIKSIQQIQAGNLCISLNYHLYIFAQYRLLSQRPRLKAASNFTFQKTQLPALLGVVLKLQVTQNISIVLVHSWMDSWLLIMLGLNQIFKDHEVS